LGSVAYRRVRRACVSATAAKLDASCPGGCQGGLGALGNHGGLVLGNCSQDVQREARDVWVIDRHDVATIASILSIVPAAADGAPQRRTRFLSNRTCAHRFSDLADIAFAR
jgi:hypothetical protein